MVMQISKNKIKKRKINWQNKKLLEFKGKVTELLPNAMFRVKLREQS